ncbi:MAG: AMP-binding protein, partial [Oscillospiraceae bacterium]|nr:AMP-binding protein [Oscillospiraceae bacterium]
MENSNDGIIGRSGARVGDRGLVRATLGEWMENVARDYPDNDALVYHDRGLRLSYREFNAVCRRAAKAFYALGVRKDDKVAIWAPNVPEWAITAFGCVKIGAVLVTVNTNYKIFELEYLMRQSDSKVLLFSDGIKGSDYLAILSELLEDRGRVPVLEHVIHLAKHDGSSPPVPQGISEWDEFLKLGDGVSDETLDAVMAELDPDDIINMQYTSGTTGFPKGVCLTHYNILNNGKSIGDCMALTPKDRLCIPVPFFHCFGMVLAMMACVTHASAMVPVEVYSPLQVMQTVQGQRCTALHGVPTMFIFILEHPDFEKFDFSSLRTGIMAGSTCPMEVMKSVQSRLNMREIVITYGQTESSPGITMSQTDDPLEKRVSTVGRLLPFVEAKIADPETGAELPDGTPGEICSRGYHIMKGYYKMPEATAQAIDAEGWLHTGDIGVRDSEGYYSITGRLKDMIIRGGENIYPREIEELLYTHPGVSDVQVVAVPSRKFGEEVCAFVIPAEGASVDEAGIKDFVASRMSRHKIPSFVLL